MRGNPKIEMVARILPRFGPDAAKLAKKRKSGERRIPRTAADAH
jgi:hypothetical protein